MSFQDAILREAGPNTLETIKRLEKKLGKTAGTLRTVVQNNTLISVSKHAHTHATGGTMQTGVGTDPIGPYDYTWTGRHTFTPAEDEVPVTINASGASHTADVFRVFDNASGRSFEMAAGGKGGFNAPTMNAQVNIRAGVAIVDPLTLGSGPDLWLRHEELRIAADAVPLNDGDRLPDGAFTWPDASGNSRDYSEQATEDPSPIYRRGAINALDALQNGTTGQVGYMESVGDLTLSGSYTVAFIYRSPATAVQAFVWGGRSSGASNHQGFQLPRSGNLGVFVYQLSATPNQIGTAPSASTSTFYSIIIRRNASNVYKVIWDDGTDITTGPAAAGSMILNSLFKLRDFTPSGETVYLVELICYNGDALSDGDLDLLHNYLKDRKGAAVAGGGDILEWQDVNNSYLGQIDSSGNLGLTVDPTVRLHVASDGNVCRFQNAANTNYWYVNFLGTSRTEWFHKTVEMLLVRDDSGEMRFRAQGNSLAGSYAASLRAKNATSNKEWIWGIRHSDSDKFYLESNDADSTFRQPLRVKFTADDLMYLTDVGLSIGVGGVSVDGSADPSAALQVGSDSGAQLRLLYETSSLYTTFTEAGSGRMTIRNNGGDIWIENRVVFGDDPTTPLASHVTIQSDVKDTLVRYEGVGFSSQNLTVDFVLDEVVSGIPFIKFFSPDASVRRYIFDAIELEVSGTFGSSVTVAQFFFPTFTSTGTGLITGANSISTSQYRLKPSTSTSNTRMETISAQYEFDSTAELNRNFDDIWVLATFPKFGSGYADTTARTVTRAGHVYMVPGTFGGSGRGETGATITTWASLRIDKAKSGTLNPTITNCYGIHLQEQTDGTTQNREIFIEGSGGVFFRDGDLRIESLTDGHLDLSADISVDCNADFDISAKNIITDTSTGTKIATGTTQKLGFFNATPVVQRTDFGALTDSSGGTADGTVAAVVGSGADGTINDNFAECATNINAIRTVLRDLGLMA